MVQKLRIALAAALLAAMIVPVLSVTSYAGDDALSDAYSHKHDNHGW